MEKRQRTKNKSSSKVRIFTTATCPYCKLTKEFLKKNGIEYKEVDVGSDLKAAQEMVKKTGQMGVPVTFIGEKYVIGFDREALKKILKL